MNKNLTFPCISSWKVDRFMLNKDQNDKRPFLHFLSNTFHRRNRIIFAIFVWLSVCLSVCHVLFVYSFINIIFNIKLTYNWVIGNENVEIVFGHIFVKSESFSVFENSGCCKKLQGTSMLLSASFTCLDACCCHGLRLPVFNKETTYLLTYLLSIV